MLAAAVSETVSSDLLSGVRRTARAGSLRGPSELRTVNGVATVLPSVLSPAPMSIALSIVLVIPTSTPARRSGDAMGVTGRS